MMKYRGPMLRQGFAGQAVGKGQSILGPLQYVKGVVLGDKLSLRPTAQVRGLNRCEKSPPTGCGVS